MQGSQDYLLHMIKEAMVKWATVARQVLCYTAFLLDWSDPLMRVPHLTRQTLNTVTDSSLVDTKQ